MNLQMQWLTLLWMFASGAILGIAFDSYRVVSGQFRFPRWTIHVLDMIYWLLSSLFVFRALYYANQGQLRFYVFLGLFIGVWIYFLFLSVLTERFMVMLIKIVKWFYGVVVRITQIFVITPILWLFKLMKWLLGLMWVVLLFLGRITLSPVWRLVAWVGRPIIKKLRIPDNLAMIRNKMVKVWTRWTRWLYKE